MNPIRRVRRLAAALTGLACAWLGIAVAAPAAFALPVPPLGGGSAGVTPPPEPPGWNKHPPVSHVHTVVAGGMPGWQIALIALGAALLAATAAVLLDRAWAARRKPVTADPEPSAPGADVLSVP
jgi:hypothetical protein